MALTKYIIDARIKVSGKTSILGLQNPLDLNQHIKNVITHEDTTLELEGTYKVDSLSELTAGNGIELDGGLMKDGGARFVGSATYFAAYYPAAGENDIAAGTGGAISIVRYLTTINTDAGGDAFTLADGVVAGQMKKIRLVVDGGGDAVITPANLSGGTTITMNDANDFVILCWDGTDWVCIENSGCTIA